MLYQFTCAQMLKDVMKGGGNWENLEPYQKECLEMMATKMSRILEGNPNHVDHWEDLSGYPELVAIHLKGNKI